ncbi:hypothetical protein [Nocardia seriolae]|nr:hypothetical protein [Nocardia seriolae]APB01655.1 hypothetical protein NS506_07635 [Nocardia seriolae]MTJ60872.1 hypothetical protein [Nocardia seriolae]MTJ75708.1 hypothetical protein [Nocardia seriolae]MTJ90990.1 hypothetical protein [Nocardia seriolae]MTK38854.1 hypothetical protein [Nocardia seriolae]
MRIRTAVATVGIAFAGAAVAATASAGSAAAFTPHINPGHGVVVSVDLTHDETVALANTWIPAAIDQINGVNNRIALDPYYSDIPVVDGVAYANLTEVVGEAAGTPGGQVGMAVVNSPVMHGGNFLLVEDLGGWDYYLQDLRNR